MKERVLKGWNLKRILYLLGGLAAIIMGVTDRDYLIGFFGLYFVSMAVFSFGCASGSCRN